jgi:hypothetical protein
LFITMPLLNLVVTQKLFSLHQSMYNIHEDLCKSRSTHVNE